jgi:hypothetical protein
MENTRPGKRAPTSNVTVGRRGREYLTEREVERLIEAARQNRSGHRDATAILVAYRHGLRASEVVVLRWDDAGPRVAMPVCIRYQPAKVAGSDGSQPHGTRGPTDEIQAGWPLPSVLH